MEIQDELLTNKKKDKKHTGEKNIRSKKTHVQYNFQDLDQEQNVDVNPVQLNTQNLHIFINNDKNNYSGEIKGVTYLEEDKKLASNVDIFVFFGNEDRLPVYKTKSDTNGNFVIPDIPPGYYTLLAKLEEGLQYQSHYIKVLTGDTVHHSILLSK